MPLSRSHVRNKSRSPAPNALSMFTSPSRTPAFLPPSHYAAAAGLNYPLTPETHETESSCSSEHHATASYAPTSSGVPLSYPTQTFIVESSSIESTHAPSSHFNAVSRFITRSPSRSSSISRSDSRSGKNDKEKGQRDRRKSHLGDIPLLEMQLLPSLRDTVDRMTHPPKIATHDEDNKDVLRGRMSPSSSLRSSKQRLHEHPSANSLASLSTALASRRGTSGYASSAQQPTATQSLSSPLSQSNTPKNISTPQTWASTSTPYCTPRSAIKSSPMKTPSTPKTTLKSSIRGNSTATPSTSEIPSTRTTPAKSLRSMKSMIAKQKGPATQPDVSRFGSSRIRSRTGEDVSPVTKPHKSLVPIPKSKSKSNPSTPQLSHRISTFRSPQPLRASQVASQPSSIPRTKLPQRNVVNDSGSELERQFARTLSPGRLVVTNAIIVPSSSESEASDREKEPFRSEAWTPRPTGIATRNPSRDIVDPLPPNRSPRPLSNASRKPVGLGFNLDADLNGPSQRFDIDEDDESVYDAGEAFAQPLLKDEVIPSRYSDDEDSIYEEDLDHPHERRAQLYSAVQNCLPPEQEERQDEAECKRREALLGIVDGLHLDFGLTDATYRQSTLSESESDNNYSAQGLAISGSGDFQDRANDIVHPTILEEQFSCEEILSDGDSFIEELEQQSASSLRNRRQSVMHSTRSPSSSRSLQKSRQLSNTESTSRSHLSPSVPSPRALWDRHLSTSPRSVRATLSPELRHDTGRGSIDIRTTSTQDKSPCNSRTSLFKTRSTIQRASPISQDRCNDIHSNVSHDLMDVSRYDDTAAEREAFGIPASLSYGGNVTPEEEVTYKRPPIVAADSISSLEIGLTRVDSDSSLMDGARWSEQTRSSKELSKGAAALFKTLTVKGGYARSRGAEERRNPDRYSPAIDRQPSYVGQQGHDDCEIPRPKRSLDSLSVSSSASTPSIYDEDINDTDPDTAGTSWRSTLQPSIYNTLRSHYGPVEMQRQELIYELFISEQEFVRHLRSIVKLFILPLRSRDSKTWLPGVPTEVSKLFDWLEDIVNLHGLIARSLKTVAGIWRTGAIVERLAETLRAFIPRLEVYQPYIVRLGEVKDTIVDYISDDNGEFGEYLRMKERDVQNDGSRLEHLLEEPVVRLSKYPDIFQRLLDFTRQDHADHLSTISLLHSTRIMIKVMEEVKVREEEYEFVKDIASHIEGIPHSVPLARRARRLLYHGPLHVTLTNEERLKSGSMSSTPKIAGEPQRVSKLATAIHDWGVRRTRSGSISSSASSTLSMRSYDTTSSSSASIPATTTSDKFVASSGRALAPYSPTRNLSDSRQGDWHSASAGNRLCEPEILQVLVFTDLIVLASSPVVRGNRGTPRNSNESWHLLNRSGLSRILDVTERKQASDHGVTLDLLPVGIDELDTGVIPEDAPVIQLSLSFPVAAEEDVRQRWLDALNKCRHYTLRSLSFPSHSGSYLAHGPNVDLELDTRQSVMAILSSGLPLPKSPSIQIAEVSMGQASDTTQQEREERGWWSLRFQQVLREMQRQDVPLSLLEPQRLVLPSRGSNNVTRPLCQKSASGHGIRMDNRTPRLRDP